MRNTFGGAEIDTVRATRRRRGFAICEDRRSRRQMSSIDPQSRCMKEARVMRAVRACRVQSKAALRDVGPSSLCIDSFLLTRCSHRFNRAPEPVWVGLYERRLAQLRRASFGNDALRTLESVSGDRWALVRRPSSTDTAVRHLLVRLCKCKRAWHKREIANHVVDRHHKIHHEHRLAGLVLRRTHGLFLWWQITRRQRIS